MRHLNGDLEIYAVDATSSTSSSRLYVDGELSYMFTRNEKRGRSFYIQYKVSDSLCVGTVGKHTPHRQIRYP